MADRAKLRGVQPGDPWGAHLLGGARVAVVIGPGLTAVADEARRVVPAAEIFEQTERRGTAHAVLAAKTALAKGADDVLVLFGDTPLVRADVLARLRKATADGAAVQFGAMIVFRRVTPVPPVLDMNISPSTALDPCAVAT